MPPSWQHHQLRAVLAAARTQVVLCWPRGDLRRSTEHLASRWLLDVVGARTGARVWSHDVLQLRAPWIEHVPSFGAGVAATAFPATAQEHRLHALLDGRRRWPPIPPSTGAHALLRARRSAALHRVRRQPRRLAGPVPR